MHRMSLLDSQFLHLEDRTGPLHIAAVCTFEGEAPSRAELRAHVASKLDRVPRYRERVREVPFELGRPVWVDDAHFDLAFHLRRAALPAPGDAAALCEVAGEIMSHELDRTRPLWELWQLEGLAEGRWALLIKVHHCMVDGVSGVDLLMALLDPDPSASIATSASLPWLPAPEPSGGEMVQDAWQGLAEESFGWAQRFSKSLKDPDALKQAVLDKSLGLLQWAVRLIPIQKLSIEGSVGTRRTYAFHTADLRSLNDLRKTLGGTLNDLVLTIIAGAYRRFLLERGEALDGTDLHTLVPVSVRTESEHGRFDNRVSAMLCELPIGEPSLEERVRRVREEMQYSKSSHMAEAGDFLMNVGNLAPPMLVGPITRLVARTLREVPQRSIQTVVTNVPGPPVPLYLRGRKLSALLPYVPIYQGVRTGIAVISYHRQITFGITADLESTPDLARLTQAIALEIAALTDLARSQRTESRDVSMTTSP